MRFLSFFGLSAASAVVATAQNDWSPPTNLDWAVTPDETADWYKEHQNPPPALAPEITVVEENKSYIVKLECPECPFLVKESFSKAAWRKQENSLLLKFDVRDSSSEPSRISTIRLNGFSILPLDPMPLHINAVQTAANLTQETMDRIVESGLLDPDFAWQTKYHHFPLRYEHTLLRTETTGQWRLQLDVTGLQYGESGEPLIFDERDHRLVQILISKRANSTELSINNIEIVEKSQRAQPLKMKCGKLAVVQTTFNPEEWDEYGMLGSWSRVWYMIFGKIGQYWEDHIVRNTLLPPVALLLAFIIFFARIWVQKRQQEKTIDAEYALLEPSQDDLPPAYSDVPIIKIEQYD